MSPMPAMDTHAHINDPARSAYVADAFYRPAGQEVGSVERYLEVHYTLKERSKTLVLQVERDQLAEALPIPTASGVTICVDHCGRPDPRLFGCGTY